MAWLYIFLIFMSVFGIWPIFEMHKGMWPGYTFSFFHGCFRHLAHFGNTRRHATQLYFFSSSRAFFCICWFQIVFGIFKTHRGMRSGYTYFVFMSIFGILSIFEMHRCMWSSHIFFVFMGDLKKVIKVNFRSVIQLKYKKVVKKKFSFPAIKTRLGFNKKCV